MHAAINLRVHGEMIRRALLCALLSLASYGQCQTSDSFRPPRNEFAVWAGGSWLSGHSFGGAKDRHLVLAGLRYSHLAMHGRSFALKLTMDVLPAAILFEPQGAVYGWGFSPVGAQMNFRPRRRWQPFAASSAGFLRFNRRVLSPDASRFNFTVDLGGGVQAFRSRGSSVFFGYAYHHLSNANIADRNPGTDSNLFYIGYSLGK